MQPQSPMPPISSPAPNPAYDFILRDPQQPKRRFGLPTGLPKPMKILVILGGLFVVAIIIVVVASSTGGSDNSQQMIAAAGRAQEIARVSTLVQTQSNDPNTQYLAATAQISLTSEQSQITAYLAKHGIKVSTAQLNAYQNKNTDAQLSTAQQNNSLEKTYDAYLKTSLSTYQSELVTAGKGASQKTIALLNDAYFSSQVLLNAPEITSLATNS